MIIASTSIISGCGEKTLTEDVTKIYDTIDSNNDSGKIVPQYVDVKGEDNGKVKVYRYDRYGNSEMIREENLSEK